MESKDKRFMTMRECADYLGIGISTTRRYMQEIGAVKRIGKRCLYDRKVIDAFFESSDSLQVTKKEA